MIKWNDYHIRVYEDGDVSIHLQNSLEYATMFGTYGLQCNADDGTFEYRRILQAARAAGDAMASLDEAIMKAENVVDT